MMITVTSIPASADAPPIAGASETGALGVCGLKRAWSRTLRARQGLADPASAAERHLDYLIIHA